MKVLLSATIGAALWAQAPAAPAPKPGATPAAASADPVVLTVGSTKITKSGFEILFKNQPDTIRAEMGGDEAEAKRRFAEQYGDVIIYASEARKLKLDSDPVYKAEVHFQEQSLLAGILYKHMLESGKRGDEESKAWFDSHKGDYEQSKARQILIRFKGSRVPVKGGQEDLSEEAALAKARAIRERIVKGEDFAAVAKVESDDPASAAKGGDLGTFGHGRLLPELDKAAFSQPSAEVGQPVKSQFGWHVIQVQDRRVQGFDEVKGEIAKKLQTESAQKAMQGFASSTKLILEEAYFGKPASAQPAQAGPAQPVK